MDIILILECFSIIIIVTGANKLTGSIPSEFGMLSKLENIALGHNNLDGTLPTELAMINGLKKLDFGDNMLTGPIPSEFGTFAALEVMIIGKCISYVICMSYSHKILVSIHSNCVIVLILYDVIFSNIGDNGMTGTIPTEISNINSLEVIDIGEF